MDYLISECLILPPVVPVCYAKYSTTKQYVRVSTDEQAEKGFSQRDQEKC